METTTSYICGLSIRLTYIFSTHFAEARNLYKDAFFFNFSLLATCKGIQDSLRFWNPRFGFRIPCQDSGFYALDFGFFVRILDFTLWIPDFLSGFRILRFGFRIPCQDSGFYALDSGFLVRILDFTLWIPDFLSGFWILRFGFRISCQWNLDSGFQSLVGLRILQAKISRIPLHEATLRSLLHNQRRCCRMYCKVLSFEQLFVSILLLLKWLCKRTD